MTVFIRRPCFVYYWKSRPLKTGNTRCNGNWMTTEPQRSQDLFLLSSKDPLFGFRGPFLVTLGNSNKGGKDRTKLISGSRPPKKTRWTWNLWTDPEGNDLEYKRRDTIRFQTLKPPYGICPVFPQWPLVPHPSTRSWSRGLKKSTPEGGIGGSSSDGGWCGLQGL